MKDFIKTDAFKALVGCMLLGISTAVTWYIAGYGDGQTKGYHEGYADGHKHRQDWYYLGYEDGRKYERLINNYHCPEEVEDLTK